VGYKSWDEIKEIVGKARFMVIPSEWYENYPLSIIESLCLGTPVLGAKIGGIPEMIEEGKNGMLFESRNAEDLKYKIQKMYDLKVDYKILAEESQQRYSAENYYKELMKIYK
jgi:glycosyltransferase involved in cell wall biosynthesis